MEYKRRGQFIMVFPNENYQLYKQFFEDERVSDKILYENLALI